MIISFLSHTQFYIILFLILYLDPSLYTDASGLYTSTLHIPFLSTATEEPPLRPASHLCALWLCGKAQDQSQKMREVETMAELEAFPSRLESAGLMRLAMARI